MRTVRAPGQRSTTDAITKTPIATHALSAGDWAVGRTLAEVNLRADTGALVIAVLQEGATPRRRRPICCWRQAT